MGLAEALSMIPASLLAGFAVFVMFVRSQLGGQWLWLRTWSERLAFYLWPFGPRNVVRLVDEHGRHLLFFDVPIRRERDGGVIAETPVGWLRSPPASPAPAALTEIHGKPGPYELAMRAAAGLGAAWLTYYYGGYALYSLGATVFDQFYLFVAFVYLAYPWVWWSVASRTAVEYWAFAWAGLSPPFIYAEPLVGETITPLEYTRLKNRPVVIRVSRYAREALEEVKRSLGLRGEGADTTAASVLGIAELYELLIEKAADVKARARRVEELLGAFRVLEVRFGRITIGKVALLALMFLVGVLVGFALGGGSVVIAPVPHNASTAGVWGP